MSGISDHVEIDTTQVQRLAADFLAKGGKLTPVYKAIGEYMRLEIENRFDKQVDPSGKKWQKLSPVTLLKKKNNKILTERGNLRNSFNYKASANSVDIGTPDVRAAALHYGAAKGSYGTFIKKVKSHSRKNKYGRTFVVNAHNRSMLLPWGNIPARPILGVNEANKTEMLNILKDFLTS